MQRASEEKMGRPAPGDARAQYRRRDAPACPPGTVMAIVVPTFRRPAPTPAPRAEPRRSRLGGRHRNRLLLALTLTPLLVSAVALVVGVGRAYTAYGDQAVIELRTRDVGHHPVLIGLFSRDLWSHPPRPFSDLSCS